jgi:hypothetical protein
MGPHEQNIRRFAETTNAIILPNVQNIINNMSQDSENINKKAISAMRKGKTTQLGTCPGSIEDKIRR